MAPLQKTTGKGPLSRLPGEILINIFNLLPLKDQLTLIRLSKQHCSLLVQDLHKHITPLRIDRSNAEIRANLVRNRSWTKSLILHSPCLDEYQHKPDEDKYKNLSLMLSRILKVYSGGKKKIDILAFTAPTTLDELSYGCLEGYLDTQSSLRTAVLPPISVSTTTSENETCPMGVVLQTSHEAGKGNTSKDLVLYLRQGCKIQAARKLIVPSEQVVVMAHFYGNQCRESFNWGNLDNLDQSWHDVRDISFDSFYSADIPDCPALRMPERIMSLSISNTNTSHSSWEQYEAAIANERSLLVDHFALARKAMGATFPGITLDVLLEFLGNITNLKTLCFHQWVALPAHGMAACASMHRETLISFSWRASTKEFREEDALALVDACPELQALGVNGAFARVCIEDPQLFREPHVAELFLEKAKSFFGGLKGLTNLHTLCIFTTKKADLSCNSVIKNNEDPTILQVVTNFLNVAADNGLPSLRVLHFIHYQYRNGGASSFKVYFAPNPKTLKQTAFVSVLKKLTDTEENVLHALGGSPSGSVSQAEYRHLGDLYPSTETLARFLQEEKNEYRFGFPRAPFISVTPKRKASDDQSEKTPRKKRRRGRKK
ncbi:unnamed protein product [Periconia digitata]|uniref:F-box domain-containing protein n=1 Tax=Periconia digitata TaxID=1303443 RepID=A0A9W4UKX1_9PLEO|nr:unnamed protein product [Periconia digitata]